MSDFSLQEYEEYEELRRQATLEQLGIVELLPHSALREWVGRWHVETVEALLAAEFPPQRWLVEGLVPTEGLALMTAESGTYKTWLALDLAISVATGQDWLKLSTTKAKVLYINGEIPRREAQRRVRRLGVTGDFAGEFAFLHTNLALDSRDDFDDFKEFVKREKFDLIIGDTLSKLHSSRCNENDNTQMTELLVGMRELANASEGVFLILHHLAKPPGFPVSQLNRIRGASVIRDNAGSILSLRRAGKRPNVVEISNTKNWYTGVEPQAISVTLRDSDDLSSFVVLEKSPTASEDVEDEVLAAIETLLLAHGSFTPTSLRELLHSDAAIKLAPTLQDELVADGTLKRRKESRYTVYERGDTE